MIGHHRVSDLDVLSLHRLARIRGRTAFAGVGKVRVSGFVIENIFDWTFFFFKLARRYNTQRLQHRLQILTSTSVRDSLKGELGSSPRLEVSSIYYVVFILTVQGICSGMSKSQLQSERRGTQKYKAALEEGDLGNAATISNHVQLTRSILLVPHTYRRNQKQFSPLSSPAPTAIMSTPPMEEKTNVGGKTQHSLLYRPFSSARDRPTSLFTKHLPCGMCRAGCTGYKNK